MSTENLPYHPYTKEEYLELKETFERNVTTILPDHLADWCWNNYRKIAKSNEPTPCKTGCGGAAAHWRKAVETIRAFINKVENVNE